MRAMSLALRHELVGLGGVIERNIYLVKRYIWWDIAFFLWTVANTLTIVFIAKGINAAGGKLDVDRATTTLLIGAVIWSYLGVLFEILIETVAWERWEGTIESTFMAPVPRVTHLLGMCGATMVRALGFSVAILAAVALFVPVDLSHANAVSALALLGVGAVAFIGLAIGSAIFPLLWTEKGLQMAYIVQAVVLLVSGVYYPTDILPAWMQPLSFISPATYVIRGMRDALLDGADLAAIWPNLWPALLVGAISIPLGIRVFLWAERHAKRTGRLKRSG